jgi:preprotein translocase subunit SecD
MGVVGVIAVAALASAAPRAVAATATKHTVEFRPVLTTLPRADPSGATTSAATQAVASCDPSAVAALASVPTTKPKADVPDDCVVLAAGVGSFDGDARYYLGPARVQGGGIRSARAQLVPGQGWTVTLRLTKSGSKAWDALAQQQFHRQVALVLDHSVVSAPQIQPADMTFTSFDGIAVISGSFSQRQAVAVADAIDR